MGLSAAAGRMEAVGKYLKAGMVTGGEMRRGAKTERFFSTFLARYRDKENAGGY